GGLAVVAGRAAEWVCRAMRWPVRWVWAAALLVCVALAAAAPLRGSRASHLVDVTALELPSAALGGSPAATMGFAERVAGARLAMERTLIAPVERGLLALRAHASPRVNATAGVPVRVSPTLGPVVIGVTRPEIVVPAWLLERGDAEQRLAVAHEREHVR